jgi:hypothetical protein
MCVLINSRFTENPSMWSWLTLVILRWGCYNTLSSSPEIQLTLWPQVHSFRLHCSSVLCGRAGCNTPLALTRSASHMSKSLLLPRPWFERGGEAGRSHLASHAWKAASRASQHSKWDHSQGRPSPHSLPQPNMAVVVLIYVHSHICFNHLFDCLDFNKTLQCDSVNFSLPLVPSYFILVPWILVPAFPHLANLKRL